MRYEIATTFGYGNEQALSIVKEISSLETTAAESIEFDFRRYNENNPFSNLVIANAIRDYKRRHSQQCSLIPHHSSYLSHLGFYHMIGANFGKELGEAIPNSNYVPITEIQLDHTFYQTVERTSKNLAKLLNFDKDLETFLTYIFIETIRNVYEHAEAHSLYVAAQKWPRFDLLEIAIADNGCGIAHSLQNRFPKLTEQQLLSLACQPGISACSNFAYTENDDGWRNSGYGLYMLRKLSIEYGGSFLICSGRKALLQTPTSTQRFETDYSGTALAIRIKTNLRLDFDKTRAKILKEGELKSKEIQGAIQKASRSSGGHYT